MTGRESNMAKQDYWVYILANRYNTVLYVGMTNELDRRIREHREGTASRFTRRYNVQKLVYVEAFTEVGDAIAREKQLKSWRRSWKEALIQEQNPSFKDLHEW